MSGAGQRRLLVPSLVTVYQVILAGVLMINWPARLAAMA